MLKARYYPQGNLEDTVFTGNASSTWQAISHGLDLLKKGLVWRVGNGKSIKVWRNNWIPQPFSYRPITQRVTCRIRYVSDLLTDNGSWDSVLLQQYFIPADVEEILKIRASPRLGDNVIAWGPGNLGVFTVKSAYMLAFEEAIGVQQFLLVLWQMEVDLAGSTYGRAGFRPLCVILHGAFPPMLSRHGRGSIESDLKP